MKVALDTNILAYAEGVNGGPMKEAALDLLSHLPHATVMLPVQVLGELFQVLVKKAKRSPIQARDAILGWRDAFPLIDTSAAILLTAMDLSFQQIAFWDAVILSAAAEAECRMLLSEDMQDGFVWKGVTVVNPFFQPRNALLEALMNS